MHLSGKKRVVEKLKVTASNAPSSDSLTSKQAMLIAVMQPKDKGASKMSVNTGSSSGKVSTQGKFPASSQRNEYLST